jgi:protoheme IX farnesyltransferase
MSCPLVCERAPEDRLSRYATLALAAAIATFVLISVGGLVRATDSGLACPDWPGCFAFNDWIPAAELQPWIEHTHRLIASLAVGPLVAIVGLWTLISRDKRRDLPLLAAAVIAGVLVIVQSLIGRSVVMEGLAAELVTIHLGMALTVFAATIFIAERAAHGPLPVRPADRGLLRLGAVTLAAIFAQMLLGSWVTGHGAGLAYSDFPLMNGRLVPDLTASQQVVQVLHRLLAAAVAGLVIATWLRVRRATDRPLPRRLATAMLVLVLVQVALGAANIWSQLSAWFVVPHLAVGSALWGASVWLALSLRRLQRADIRVTRGAGATDASPGRTDTLRAYVALTKPRIIELLLVTTIPTMVLAQRGLPSLWLMVATVTGGTLAAGGANTINQVIDRDIDDIMRRTRHRPLPSHAISPRAALTFGIVLSIVSFAFLTLTVNLLAALLSASAIAFYVFVYTLWLKRSTPQNIVIGGAAGCVPVLVAWAAVTGRVEVPALILFAIVFYWTPPHFWALALRYRGDYAAARIPMLPVVRGEAETARQIVIYTLLLVAVSLLLLPAARMGWIYLVAAVGLGAVFVVYALRIHRDASSGRAAISLFRFSISYLTLLFAAVAADTLLRLPLG